MKRTLFWLVLTTLVFALALFACTIGDGDFDDDGINASYGCDNYCVMYIDCYEDTEMTQAECTDACETALENDDSGKYECYVGCEGDTCDDWFDCLSECVTGSADGDADGDADVDGGGDGDADVDGGGDGDADGDTDEDGGTVGDAVCPGGEGCIMCDPDPITSCDDFAAMGSDMSTGCCLANGNTSWCTAENEIVGEDCDGAGCCFGTYSGNPAHVCCGSSNK